MNTKFDRNTSVGKNKNEKSVNASEENLQITDEMPKVLIEDQRPQEEKDKDYLDNKAVERLERDEEIIDIANRLRSGEILSEQERKAAVSLMERANDSKIYNELSAGDKVMTFIVPSGGALSIKNMNDNVFGMQGTDEIIAKRRQSMDKYLGEIDIAVLGSDYKTAVCKINTPANEGKDEKEIMEAIEGVCAQIDNEMKVFIKEAIDVELRKPEKDEERRKKQEKFKSIIGEYGYRVTYGVAEVGEKDNNGRSGDLSNVELSLAQTMQAALISRRDEREESKISEYGQVFEHEKIIEKLHKINSLRSEIEADLKLKGGQLHNEDGVGFDVFQDSEEGLAVINSDVLRAVRKDKFKVKEEDQELLGKIDQYVRSINILDIVKPLIHEEIGARETMGDSEVNFHERISEQAELVEKISNGIELTEAEGERAAQLLEKDSKDELCTSEAKFNAEALKIKKCIYISIDRLDLGVDLLHEYEELQQKVVRGDMELKDASVIIGDATTLAMRKLRKDALDEFNEKFPDQKFLTKVGGDELTIALDGDKVDAKAVEEFIFALHEKTNSRVVKTIIAESIRESETDDPRDIKIEHTAAQKRAESGGDISKKIEQGKRDIELSFLNTAFGASMKEGEFSNFYDKIIEILELSSFYPAEDGSGFKILSRVDNGEIKERSDLSVIGLLSDVQKLAGMIDKYGMSEETILENVAQIKG